MTEITLEQVTLPGHRQAPPELIEIYQLRSRTVELRAVTYGAIITSVMVPNRDGVWENVVLGHGAVDRYIENRAYLGAVIGRYAGRIAGARFELDGQTHHLDANDAPNHRHGGWRGFDQHVWTATTAADAESSSVSFWRLSGDGEAGYPGALGVRVSYTLTAAGEIIIDYEARAHQPTVVNLTQHTYFNLSGNTRRDTRDHQLTIHADRFMPVGPGLLPTGALEPVVGTPFDFRTPVRIADRLAMPHQQLTLAGGFDHTWELNRQSSNALVPAARLHDPRSGRTLVVSTTEPGLQFYDGHRLGSPPNDAGADFPPGFGICLQTQHYPDSPHQPAFPSTVLRPGESYRSQTTWKLGVD